MPFDDSYFELYQRTSGAYVVARTERPFETVPRLRGSCRGLMAATRHIRRDRSVLVVDLRRSQGRNDAAFEQAFAETRHALYAGWAFAGALCLTEVGRMHVRRHMLSDGYSWPVECDAILMFGEADRVALELRG